MSRTVDAPRAWQRMLSGRRLDLLHPLPGDIEIEDIAHGLARVARWNGQTEGPNIFSVAQHSVLVERVAGLLDPGLSDAERLSALLHDGPEYVVGDLISPFKVVIGEAYKAVEYRLLQAILARFGLPLPSTSLAALITRADTMAAFCEATQLAGFAEAEAAQLFGRPPALVTEALARLTPLRSQDAEEAFSARFDQLVAALHGRED
jgi:5'-deoxynucleotidase YfbR-like HD superfamily hydrolase